MPRLVPTALLLSLATNVLLVAATDDPADHRRDDLAVPAAPAHGLPLRAIQRGQWYRAPQTATGPGQRARAMIF